MRNALAGLSFALGLTCLLALVVLLAPGCAPATVGRHPERPGVQWGWK